MVSVLTKDGIGTGLKVKAGKLVLDFEEEQEQIYQTIDENMINDFRLNENTLTIELKSGQSFDVNLTDFISNALSQSGSSSTNPTIEGFKYNTNTNTITFTVHEGMGLVIDLDVDASILWNVIKHADTVLNVPIDLDDSTTKYHLGNIKSLSFGAISNAVNKDNTTQLLPDTLVVRNMEVSEPSIIQIIANENLNATDGYLDCSVKFMFQTNDTNKYLPIYGVFEIADYTQINTTQSFVYNEQYQSYYPIFLYLVDGKLFVVFNGLIPALHSNVVDKLYNNGWNYRLTLPSDTNNVTYSKGIKTIHDFRNVDYENTLDTNPWISINAS